MRSKALSLPKRSEAPRPCLPTGRHRAGLPGNVDMITESTSPPPLPTGRKAGHPADLPAKKLVSIVIGPFRRVLFPEPSMRAWTYFCWDFYFFTPSQPRVVEWPTVGVTQKSLIISKSFNKQTRRAFPYGESSKGILKWIV